MAVKGRASSREANIRDSAAVPILVTAIHRMPVASTAMGVDATGLWRRLAGSIRKTMSGWCRTYLYHVISSGSSKEDDTETAGEQDVYDLGARRGSNYKTPMERF